MAALGHTVDTDGTTGDYASMQALSVAQAQDLTDGGGDTYTATLQATTGAVDSTGWNFSGWTTSAAFDLTLQAAVGHKALKTGIDTGRYRYTGGTAFVSVNYINFLYIQTVNSKIQFTGGTGLYFFDGVFFDGDGIESRSAAATGDVTIIRSVIYRSGTRLLWCDNAVTMSAYNCVLHGDNSIEGIRDGASTTTIMKNCAVFNTSNDFNLAGSTTLDYNASDDGDGSNPVAPASGNWANEFSNVAAGNFTLVTGGNCEGGGTNDPGSGLYSTDMDGDAYTSPWSIGVDAKTGAPPVGGIARSKIGMTLAGDGMTGRF